MEEINSTFEQMKAEQILYNVATDHIERLAENEIKSLYEQMKDGPTTYQNLTLEMITEAIKDFEEGKNINNKKEHTMKIKSRRMGTSSNEAPEEESYKKMEPLISTYNGLSGTAATASNWGSTESDRNPVESPAYVTGSSWTQAFDEAQKEYDEEGLPTSNYNSGIVNDVMPRTAGEPFSIKLSEDWTTQKMSDLPDSVVTEQKSIPNPHALIKDKYYGAAKKAAEPTEMILGTVSDDGLQINVYSYGSELLLRYFVDNTYQDEIRLSRDMQKGLMNFLTSNLIK